MRGKQVLVTGGAGFIGSHLCEALLSEGCKVICLDNFCDFYSPDTKRANLGSARLNSNFMLLEGDIRDRKFLDTAFSCHRIDLVIHLAAMAGVRPSIDNPELYFDVNVNGTLNILEACSNYNVKRLVFASSSSVYGKNKVPFNESDQVDQPISPYAATKKSGELICYTWHHLFSLSTICLRFFTVYGPRQRPDLAIHKFADNIVNSRKIELYGDGSSSRDYTYISDIIKGVLGSISLLLGREEPLYRVYNLGNSHPISLANMVEEIEKAIGLNACITYIEKKPGDVDVTYADISLAQKDLGYNPEVNFQQGIVSFVEWLSSSSDHTS